MVSLGKNSFSRASYQALFRIIQKYAQSKIEGTEQLPRYGKALLIPFHPRYFGLTVIILRTVFRREFKRIPKSLLMHGIFKFIPLFQETSKQALIGDELKLFGRNIPRPLTLKGIEERTKLFFKRHSS